MTRQVSRILVVLSVIVIGAVAVLPPRKAVGAAEDERVGVEGSSTTYPVAITSSIADKDVKLVLTGTAQRKKGLFKVYAIAGYVEKGVAIRDATDMSQKDCAKQFHLVMERGVSGQTMAEAFIEGIHLNYPKDRFADQNNALLEFMKGHNLKEGDQVWLTHVPGVGFRCRLPGDKEVLIKDIGFATAIWEIYLGKQNIGGHVKEGLTSRLPVG